jgi:hypothetical protein
MALPIPTNLELLTLIAEKYGVDISAYEKTSERTEFVLLRLILLSISNSGSSDFDGNRPILREDLTTTGEIIGGTTVSEFLENYFFPALSPLAALSIVGDYILEYGLSGAALNRTLNWTATKRTNNITSINVAGVAQSPTGETQSGAQAITLTANQTNAFSMLVSDGNLSDSVSRSFYFRHGYYWGAMASTANITDAEIMALTGAGVGTGKILDTNRQKTFNGINGAGNYLVFAFPQSWGTPSFKVNGLSSTAFTKVRNDAFVNQNGYSEPYQVWVSNTQQNSAISAFEIL